METAASFEARYAPSSYPTYWRPRETAGTTGVRRPVPGPGGGLHSFRSATANTKQEDYVGGGSEQNKRPLMRKWEVVAPS
jgi:hypothetical protein